MVIFSGSGCAAANRTSYFSRLSEAVPQALVVIKSLGMDELPPYREIIFPVAEEHRLKIIDQLLEGNIHTQTPRGAQRKTAVPI